MRRTRARTAVAAAGPSEAGPAGEPAEAVPGKRDGGALAELRIVHRLTSALQRAATLPEFYEEAVDAVVSLLGVDRASLLLFDPDGVMRFKAWRGLSPTYRQAVEGHTPWTPADVDVDIILIEDLEADDSLSDYQPVFKAEGIGALGFVPLVHRRAVVGKFMLYYRAPHRFSDDEVALAQILAAHVALALERRQTEEDLRRQAEQLQLALAAGHMGTWEWNLTSNKVSWSPTLEALHGIPPGTFAGTFEAFQAHMHPDDRARVVKAINSVAETKTGTYSVTYRIVRPDGALRWLAASGQLLRDPHGRPQRMVGVCGDVTERERLLEAERSSVARLRSLQRVTAGLSGAVTVTDVADVVLGVALVELGARSGSLCLLDGDDLEIAAAFGYPPEVMAHWGRFPLDAELPASEAARTGRAVFLSSPAERDARYPLFAASPLVSDEAFAMVPLVTDHPIGTLVLGFTEPRGFSADDERFYETLAGQCAAALARARLYDQRDRI